MTAGEGAGQAWPEPRGSKDVGGSGQSGPPGAQQLVLGVPTEMEEKEQRMSAQHPHLRVLWENGETPASGDYRGWQERNHNGFFSRPKKYSPQAKQS